MRGEAVSQRVATNASVQLYTPSGGNHRPSEDARVDVKAADVACLGIAGAALGSEQELPAKFLRRSGERAGQGERQRRVRLSPDPVAVLLFFALGQVLEQIGL